MMEQLHAIANSGGVDPPLTGVFTQKLSGPAGRYGHHMGIIGNKVYVFGGMNSGGTPVNTMTAYNLDDNTWETLTPATPPSARYGAGTCVMNGKFYLFGGYNGGALNSCYVYDPVANAWSPILSFVGARYYLTAVPIDGKIYLHGGFDGGTQFRSTHVYDPVANTYTVRADGPVVRHGHVAVAFGGKMYVQGGLNGASPLAILGTYNPVDNSWASLADGPARAYGCAVAVGPRLYLFGGYLSGSTQYDELWVFVPGSPWVKLGSGAGKRHVPAADVYAGKMWMFGGYQMAPLVVQADMWMIG